MLILVTYMSYRDGTLWSFYSLCHTFDDHVVFCLDRMRTSDAEGHTLDDIQVHISNQESEDTFYYPLD